MRVCSIEGRRSHALWIVNYWRHLYARGVAFKQAAFESIISVWAGKSFSTTFSLDFTLIASMSEKFFLGFAGPGNSYSTKGTPPVQPLSSCIRSSIGRHKPGIHYILFVDLSESLLIFARSNRRELVNLHTRWSQVLEQAIGRIFGQHVIVHYRHWRRI